MEKSLWELIASCEFPYLEAGPFQNSNGGKVRDLDLDCLEHAEYLPGASVQTQNLNYEVSFFI